MPKTLSLNVVRYGDQCCQNRTEVIKLLDDARAWLEGLEWAYGDRKINVEITLQLEMS